MCGIGGSIVPAALEIVNYSAEPDIVRQDGARTYQVRVIYYSRSCTSHRRYASEILFPFFSKVFVYASSGLLVIKSTRVWRFEHRLCINAMDAVAQLVTMTVKVVATARIPKLLYCTVKHRCNIWTKYDESSVPNY